MENGYKTIRTDSNHEVLLVYFTFKEKLVHSLKCCLAWPRPGQCDVGLLPPKGQKFPMKDQHKVRFTCYCFQRENYQDKSQTHYWQHKSSKSRDQAQVDKTIYPGITEDEWFWNKTFAYNSLITAQKALEEWAKPESMHSTSRQEMEYTLVVWDCGQTANTTWCKQRQHNANKYNMNLN